jgi:hypothetical protein
MTEYLFVGGPAHQRMIQLGKDDHHSVLIPRPTDLKVSDTGERLEVESNYAVYEPAKFADPHTLWTGRCFIYKPFYNAGVQWVVLHLQAIAAMTRLS